jgi:hypothetical protein
MIKLISKADFVLKTKFGHSFDEALVQAPGPQGARLPSLLLPVFERASINPSSASNFQIRTKIKILIFANFLLNQTFASSLIYELGPML